ncbi:MAG: hypothetical protein GX076_07480 [Clostridiales bacterium]|nr:hypothetical protein [Clostridiales bacterium]
MKRYINIFVLPFIIIIFIGLFPGYINESKTAVVKSLMRERTSIMQEALYGNMSIEEAEERLYKIETHPLLESDIISLRDMEDTGIDRIKDMRFISLKQTTSLYNYLSYQTEIMWLMVGLEGEYSQRINYNISLKSFGKIYKLSDITPISE